MKASDLKSETEKFVIVAASRLTMSDLNEIRRELPSLRERLKQPDARELPHFISHFEFLAEVFEDFVEGRFDALHYRQACEVAYAIQYLVRDVDVIPDFVPDIGLVDDATVAIVVLQRNRATLLKHPKASSIDWSDL